MDNGSFFNQPRKKSKRGSVVAAPSNLIEKELEAAKIEKIPVNRIHPHPLNPRSEFDEQDLIQLAESMVSEGQLRPLILQPDGNGEYTLLAGERRWTANQKYNQWTHMDAVIRTCKSEQEELTILFADNLHKELLYIDKAMTARKLIEERGWDILYVSKLPMMGDVQSIKDSLLFFDFPKNIQNAAKKSQRFGTVIAKVIHQLLKHGEKANKKIVTLLNRGAKVSEYEELLAYYNATSDKPEKSRYNTPESMMTIGKHNLGLLRTTRNGMKLEIECNPVLIREASELLKDYFQRKEKDVLDWKKKVSRKKRTKK